MKTKLLFTLLVFFISVSASYASFPVVRAEKAVATTTTVLNSDVEEQVNEQVLSSPAVAKASDEKWIAVAFWAFLWPFAAHRWYLKWSTGWNILFILTFGGIGIWAIIDLINILTDNY